MDYVEFMRALAWSGWGLASFTFGLMFALLFAMACKGLVKAILFGDPIDIAVDKKLRKIAKEDTPE
ncbi:hypothetical protein FF098_014740 [Parvularcula flava]|uniref:Uncharacterized protein n=1 Tax=Aquisalinus luteolus TaxID=1566827 RepID=A0A8J3ERS8_9PROT|nr:hypothetical protein [Aquisalinus luteolus]NHK29175.1 hypothetical protein [Aquisalinus luteolus]GGI00078.1 hypothetical protein GCM10011355_27520 [Aquisalinus luteolus]